MHRVKHGDGDGSSRPTLYGQGKAVSARKPYPKTLASANIRALAHEGKRWPGGKKQEVAVGINKARKGERMKMPGRHRG